MRQELSPQWRPAEDARNRIVSVFPIWVAYAAVAATCLLVFLAFLFGISKHAESTIANLAATPVPTWEVASPPVGTAVPAERPRVQRRIGELLAEEVRRGLVTVTSDGPRTIITIRGAELFPPGSAQLSPSYEPIAARIGEALLETRGPIEISGHTDNTPIRTLQFPSNIELSTARAQTVMRMLARTKVPLDRMSPIGLGATRPLVPHDASTESRAEEPPRQD